MGAAAGAAGALLFLSLVGDVSRLELVKETMGLGMSEEGIARFLLEPAPLAGAVWIDTIGRDTDMYVTLGAGALSGTGLGVGMGNAREARGGLARKGAGVSPALLTGAGRCGGGESGFELTTGRDVTMNGRAGVCVALRGRCVIPVMRGSSL